jgi:hypothetical protein
MAVRTLGTAATNTLSAVLFNPSSGVMSDSDLAAINAAIKSDVGKDGYLGPYVSREGQLWIPRRGWVKLLPGDYICVDPNTGWVTLLSATAAASASYVHS